MPRQKYLIVNADDFGQSPGVNQGIIEAHERGIVTSASLMVHWPAALEAAEYNRAHPQLSLGLHLDLGEWFYRDGNWMPLYERVLLTESQAVSEEVSRQLALFRQLVGKPPSHLDSHQHVHRREPVRSVMLSLAQDLGVPLRGCHANVRSSGDFYGQTADRFMRLSASRAFYKSSRTCRRASPNSRAILGSRDRRTISMGWKPCTEWSVVWK
jgi:predicted glycoside hydrolase/deacetylase ChbG (UPF0249 family)